MPKKYSLIWIEKLILENEKAYATSSGFCFYNLFCKIYIDSSIINIKKRQENFPSRFMVDMLSF